jgi:hypothetical protein
MYLSRIILLLLMGGILPVLILAAPGLPDTPPSSLGSVFIFAYYAILCITEMQLIFIRLRNRQHSKRISIILSFVIAAIIGAVQIPFVILMVVLWPLAVGVLLILLWVTLRKYQASPV